MYTIGNTGKTPIEDRPPIEAMSDEELIALFQAGPNRVSEPDAFRELFQRYHSRIVAWCFRFLGEAEAASDVAQEVFLKMFKYLPGFRGDSKFSTWLYVIARNQCVEAIKKRANEPVHGGAAIPPDLPDRKCASAHARMEQRESHDQLWKLVKDTLNPREAEIMTLHYRQEMGLDTITRLLDLPNQSGAKAYIVSARRKLNRAIAASGR